MSTCSHSEAVLDRGRPAPTAHDCAYVEARNALIAEAERIALEMIRTRYDDADLESPSAQRELARAYLATMDSLWRQYLLREEQGAAVALRVLTRATGRLRAKGIRPSVIRRALLVTSTVGMTSAA